MVQVWDGVSFTTPLEGELATINRCRGSESVSESIIDCYKSDTNADPDLSFGLSFVARRAKLEVYGELGLEDSLLNIYVEDRQA
jgi:hypothetical protein